MKNKISFFIPMLPPTVTHQEKKISVRNGKPIVYEPPEGKGGGTSKVEAGACGAVDYESQLIQKRAELEKERAYKLQVILMCSDSLVRQAMIIKFIEGDRNVSWTYVAGRLNTSEKSLLMACKRYVASV